MHRIIQKEANFVCNFINNQRILFFFTLILKMNGTRVKVYEFTQFTQTGGHYLVKVG